MLFKTQADSKVQKLSQEFGTVLSSLKSGKYNKLAKGPSGALQTAAKSESDEMVLRRIDGLANEVKMMKLHMIKKNEDDVELADERTGETLQKKVGDSPPKQEDFAEMKTKYSQDFIDIELNQFTGEKLAE